MQLSVMDRLTLLNVLPQQGNIKTLRSLRKLREQLAFTEKENKDLEVVYNEDEGKIYWNMSKESPIDVEVGEVMRELISGELLKIDAKNELTEAHIGLYEEFVEKD